MLDHRRDRDHRRGAWLRPGGTHLVVTDIEVVRSELLERGVGVSEIRHIEAGAWTPGPSPERLDYESFADFKDPDGNTWVLQERGHGGLVA